MRRRAVFCFGGVVCFGALAALVAAAGFTPAATRARAAVSPAIFEVGTAVVSIDPTYPVYMGGYGGGPAGGTLTRHTNPLTGQAEEFAVRALAISDARGHVVELARVDAQGWFAGYQEGPYGITDVRNTVASWLRQHGSRAATSADVIVSSLHEHAAPTLMGIWGPAANQRSYLQSVAAATERALEQAYRSARPATLSWATANVPWVADTTVGQANANEGWPVDGSLLALWARDAKSGATIATYVIEPGYPNIVFGPCDLIAPDGSCRAVLATDFPTYLENWLEQRLGGTALDASSTLGDMTGPMQGDRSPSPDLPTVTLGGTTYTQTRAFDDAIHMSSALGNRITQALADARPVTTDVVGGAEQYLVSPTYNPLLVAGDDVAPLGGGQLWAAAGGNSLFYPIDRSFLPPYQVGPALGTWVTGLRIGDLLVLSEPGEFFPSIHQAWERGIHGPAGIFVVGIAQDQLGYDYPASAYPFTLYSADEQIFNPSLTLGDQVVTAGEQDARSLGFGADLTSTPETTATQNRYQRVLQPGVQLMTFPESGDLDPATGTFSTTLEGFSAPPRFNLSTPCHAPIVPGSPTCPTSRPTMGNFSWSFGDGRTATTSGRGGYFTHAYSAPGTYTVTDRACDNERPPKCDGMSLPVTVYPALQVSITSGGGQLRAAVSGGSGSVLVERWTLPDGSIAYGPSVPTPATPGTVTLTVTDSTGGAASATTTVS